MIQGPAIKPRSALPFVAFMKESSSCDAARAVAASNGWSEGCVHYGDVRQAIVYLKEQPGPKALLVEIPSAAEAPELLDRLADVCKPDMHVIVAGAVNEFSFYSWLQSIGIDHYLLQPFTADMLQKTLRANEAKKQDSSDSQDQSMLIACMGARGGVGATTVATNLAYILAKDHKQHTALLDMDPYFGTVDMAFNLQSGHGLRDALEKPDRIDDLFLDRVMVKHSPDLAILSAEEAFSETLASSASAAEALIQGVRQKYSHIIIDLPRTVSPLTRSILAQADRIVLVSELSLLSLRDLLRLRDYITGELNRPEPIVVANREGLAGKHDLKKSAFEKNYGRAIDIHLPCMMEAFSAAAAGEMLVETARNSAGMAALQQLAEKFLPESQRKETEEAPDLIAKLLRRRR